MFTLHKTLFSNKPDFCKFWFLYRYPFSTFACMLLKIVSNSIVPGLIHLIHLQDTQNLISVNVCLVFCFAGGCENGWYLYGNYCYRIMGDASVCDPQITDDPLCSADFGSAQLQCNEMDADLVSIHNKYENGDCFITINNN